jgi:cysteine desulfurase
MKLPIYMDHHATTPVDPQVLDAMLPYFTDMFGNAASIDHGFGYLAKKSVDLAREQIASFINAQPEEVVFTSGATESDNLAILGVAEQYANKGKHIITCVTEHKAVLDTCNYLSKNGWEITYLPVNQEGMVSPDELRKAITAQTVLISIMAANNEIGVISPLSEIGKIAQEHEILFHTDATQAAGYIHLDVQAMHIDLLSLSGHKVYGPKGIGALFVRNRHPRVKIAEQIHGGGHERGMRSGTLNVPGIVGLGKAVDISGQKMKSENTRLRELRNQLWNGLKDGIPDLQLNGHSTERLPHNLSIAIPGVESRSLLVMLKNDIAISMGSACTTAKVEPSHVIMALGFGEERAYSSLRFGLGRSNDKDQIQYTALKIWEAVRKLARLK